MSAGATVGSGVNHLSESAEKSPKNAELRVWPAIALLTAFWIFLYINLHADMPMSTRFVSRMIAYAILLLGFTGWWLSRSAVTWRDRFSAISLVLLLMAAASLFADKSVNLFALVLLSLPWVFTIGTIWLLVSRPLTAWQRRIGFWLAMTLTIGYFDLVRWDGLDAMQKAEISWRWKPTNEAAFLASHENAKSAVDKEHVKPWSPQPGDCLEYRGPNRDGTVTGVKLETDWQSHPPKELWRKKIGPAWSGMIVVDGHLVTQEQRGNVEVVSCYDAATGSEIWVHEDPIRFEGRSPAPARAVLQRLRMGSSIPMAQKGKLNCLKPETGEVIWSHDCVADGGVEAADIPQWGYSVSPLVVDGLVIVFAGGASDKSVLAYHAADGKLAWASASGKQSYSSPQLMSLPGQKQVLMHDTGGLAAFNVADGARLWQYPSSSALSMPMLQPHAIDSDSLVASTEPGATRLSVKHNADKWSVEPAWETKTPRRGFNDFVLREGCIYALDDGVFCCIDLVDGKRLWKKGRFGHGQILSLPDQAVFLISSDKGELILVSADREGYKELGRIQAIEGKTWNGPVLAGGRVFLRNGEEIAAYVISPSNDSTPPSKN